MSRINAKRYIEKCFKQYDTLEKNSPGINMFIKMLFKKTFPNEILPDLAEKLEKINIITEKNKENCNHIQECNLETIHNIFQIYGDISESDIENANEHDLKELKTKLQDFEYRRFLQHFEDNDNDNE